MEPSRDEILLRLTGSVAQLVCLSGGFDILAQFTDIVKRDTQPGVGECEIRVEFDGVLVKRNSRSIASSSMYLKTRAEGFQRFERRRSRLFKRGIELLDMLSDSPSLFRISAAVFPRASSTSSCRSLSFRARQRFSANAAESFDGQEIPRPICAIEPSRTAALPVRWQSSRAISGVSLASDGWPIICSVCWVCWSVIMLRKGDCSSCIDSPCRSVPSNTGSPAVFVKSASAMVSSVRQRIGLA